MRPNRRVVVQILHAARAHLVQDVVDLAETIGKVALHVVAVDAELQVDGLHERQVAGQQRQLFLGGHGIGPRDTLGDAQRSREL